jgi:hypothetical protein
LQATSNIEKGIPINEGNAGDIKKVVIDIPDKRKYVVITPKIPTKNRIKVINITINAIVDTAPYPTLQRPKPIHSSAPTEQVSMQVLGIIFDIP